MNKCVLNLTLSAAEMEAVEELAAKKNLTKAAVLRQCLRLYQTIDLRLSAGEKLFFEDAAKNKAEIMMI